MLKDVVRKGSNHDLPSIDYNPPSNIPSLLTPHQKFAKRLQYRVCNNFFYCPAFHLWTPCMPCLFVGPILYLGPTFTTVRRPDAICGVAFLFLGTYFPPKSRCPPTKIHGVQCRRNTLWMSVPALSDDQGNPSIPQRPTAKLTRLYWFLKFCDRVLYRKKRRPRAGVGFVKIVP